MIYSDIQKRCLAWWYDIDLSEINANRFLFHVIGWLLTFYFIIASIEIGNLKWMQVWVVFHIFFWYQLNRTIVGPINPPIGLLLLITIILSFVQNLLLSATLKDIPTDISLGFFSTLLLALQILFVGIILVSNASLARGIGENLSDKSGPKESTQKGRIKQKSLLAFALIGYIGYQIVFFEYEYVLYIFQFFLLLALINKTRWLETLSKRELIAYFWILAAIFLFYTDPSGVQSITFISAEQKITWFGLPFYIHLILKMYILAVIIKIPIVIIYNHATLSRKLWIAGLFQSTIPQLIQFVFLCFIFFALISSWQAENVRESFDRLIHQIQIDKVPSSLTHSKIAIETRTSPIKINGYLPAHLFSSEQPHGVMRLIKTHKQAKRDYNQEDYFLYIKSKEEGSDFLQLVKLDTAFVSILTKDVSFLAGSGLILYPFSPREWQRLVFDLPFFQEDQFTKIYPFGILSLNDSWSVLSNRTPTDSNAVKTIIGGREDIFGNQKFILGRMFIPVNSATSVNQIYFAFDTFLNIQSISSPSVIGKAFLGLLVLFLLFNSLVIRQVGKFGAQINKIIIQKFSQLREGIQQIARGNLDYKFQMEGEDEFVELAGHFNEMSSKLKHTISEAREKDRLNHELKIARQVQLSLLPVKLPEIPGYNIAASIKTANEIGGDFYDIVPAGIDKFLFTIGDVSGKGSSAAFYMAQYISLLRYSRQFTFKPDEIAIRMNKYFSTQIVDRQIFITAIIGILDLKKQEVDFVRAGHTLPILIPGDEQYELEDIQSRGMGLGLTKSETTFKKKIELKKVPLNHGDLIVFYTDGVVEAAHPPESENSESEFVEYGEKRFINLLNNSRGHKSEELMVICNDDLNSFYKDDLRIDDHTLFFLQRNVK